MANDCVRVVVLVGLLLMGQAAHSSSIQYNEWVSFDALSDMGDRVHVAIEDEQIKIIVIKTQEGEVRISGRDLPGIGLPQINKTDLLFDTPGENGLATRYLLVPFLRWRDSDEEDLALLIEFRSASIRSATIVRGDSFSRPVHIFELH